MEERSPTAMGFWFVAVSSKVSLCKTRRARNSRIGQAGLRYAKVVIIVVI